MEEGRMVDGMLTVDEKRYYAALWHVEMPKARSPYGMGGNLFAVLHAENREAKAWVLYTRFRYYRDARIHDSNDEFSVYEHGVNGSMEEAMNGARASTTLFALMALAGPVDEVLVDGNGAHFIEVIKKLPFMHCEEAQEDGQSLTE